MKNELNEFFFYLILIFAKSSGIFLCEWRVTGGALYSSNMRMIL